MILLAILIALSFFGKAGVAGKTFMEWGRFLIGETIFVFPLIFILGGLVLISKKYDFELFKKDRTLFWPVLLAVFLLVTGVTGILGSFNSGARFGGIAGYGLSWLFLKYFGFWATFFIFLAPIFIGGLIFWHFLRPEKKEKKEEKKEEKKPSVIKKIFKPKFKVKEIAPEVSRKPEPKKEEVKKEEKKSFKTFSFNPPPIDLLSKERGAPTSGDTKENSAIIKKTLENFGIEVSMSEVNIGPTVTQYTLKPAEGVKLSKITTLSNDLALSLASHPIRIEAPIPGRSLVGIEVPNTERATVRLGSLIENSKFQDSSVDLPIVLGRNVSGNAVYADMAKMPHMLVAGATGTGKTCAKDTLMFTEKGMLDFEELCPLSLNSEVNFKIKLVTRDGIEETAKNYNNGICKFHKIITSRGYKVEATTEHPLWVMNKDGSQGWKPASLIREGDYVAISRGPALFGSKTDISDFEPSNIKSYHNKISFPSKITPCLARFLGFLTADGGLSVEGNGFHRVVYTQADKFLVQLYKKYLKKLFGISRFTEIKSGSNPKNKATDIMVNSKHLKEFLLYLGMDSSKSPNKEIPRAIREAPKEIVKAYLSALFDNDGYTGRGAVELSISSKKLISQIHILLLNFGIVSSLSEKKIKEYSHNKYYRLSIFGDDARKFSEEIGFVRKEKNEKLKDLFNLSPNTNRDLIPNISSLLKDMAKKYRSRFANLTNKGWKYQSGVQIPKYAFNSLRSYNSGARMPSYQSVKNILNFYKPISNESEYQELEDISERNFYWDKVKKIRKTSGEGYDFYVPGSDSFIGNGFVNHNTIYLNSLILSLLYQPSTSFKSASPENLRLILVDPKRVEFSVYKDLPHLLCPIIYTAEETLGALKWLTGEMERRFSVLADVGSRNIHSYNEKALSNGTNPLPFIILIIDELADLMSARGRDIEASVVRLAQMARAVGIHLVLATQRPSVEVITGLIKANITSRVTFQVASQVDSRTVLDTAGAEKLLGRGDMLYLSADVVKPKRIQGPYVSEKEVKKVVKYIKEETEKEQLSTEMDPELIEETKKSSEGSGSSDSLFDEEEPLYEEAKRLVIESGKASSSLLQRRLRVGYARAARLIDMLEEKGIVGPQEGSKPREVYGEESEEDGWQKV